MKVICAKCLSELNGFVDSKGNMVVLSCKTCLNTSIDMAYREGKAHGHRHGFKDAMSIARTIDLKASLMRFNRGAYTNG